MVEPDPSAPGVLRALVLWPALFAGYATHRAHLAIAATTAIHRRLILRPTEYAHLRSFLIDTYDGEPWIGSPTDGFRFSHDKSKACWRESERLDVLLVRAGSSADLAELKDTVRKLARVGKHSMHLTDTAEETQYLWTVANAHVTRPRALPLFAGEHTSRPGYGL
ncbi:hypothetical protein CFP71_14720 [Amycolatopsis thailandensis]|uniref:Uncharacterized protein n=1 Tax=Amycolatopsis thailandensis TaxID=589330 RepID=A0A229SAW8_9PSEU|nr:hypothetical protein [Amycolatopsis thailandensis]OXM56082.1 hypothetical protein CFP71_14720 [Amycolatopsis thailandensis]